MHRSTKLLSHLGSKHIKVRHGRASKAWKPKQQKQAGASKSNQSKASKQASQQGKQGSNAKLSKQSKPRTSNSTTVSILVDSSRSHLHRLMHIVISRSCTLEILCQQSARQGNQIQVNGDDMLLVAADEKQTSGRISLHHVRCC